MRLSRTLAVLTAAALLGTLASCTKSKPAEPTPASTGSSTPVGATTATTPAAAPTTAPVPDFDVERLTKNVYLSDAGTRLFFVRDRRVEIQDPRTPTPEDPSKWTLSRGSGVKASGATVSFALDAGGERQFAVQEDGRKLVSADPAGVYTAVSPVAPDGREYVAANGDSLAFAGAKVTMKDGKGKTVFSASDVKYGEQITYTQTKPTKVERVLAIDNAGYRLVDVTPAQVIAIYSLKEVD